MTIDPRRRAKQLARKAAKRKAQLVKKKNQSTWDRASFAGWPIHESFVPDNIFQIGLGKIIVSRRIGSQVAAGVFLVDTGCLGIKNAFLTISSPLEFQSIVDRIRERTELVSVKAEYARKLIEGAVEYAEGLGFRPHKDYFKAKKIFGAINTAQCDTVFEFGRDGKPFYSSGPSESMERRRQIVEALQKRCGPGGFHYMVGIGDEDANAGYFDEEEPDDPDDEKYP